MTVRTRRAGKRGRPRKDGTTPPPEYADKSTAQEMAAGLIAQGVPASRAMVMVGRKANLYHAWRKEDEFMELIAEKRGELAEENAGKPNMDSFADDITEIVSIHLRHIKGLSKLMLLEMDPKNFAQSMEVVKMFFSTMPKGFVDVDKLLRKIPQAEVQLEPDDPAKLELIPVEAEVVREKKVKKRKRR